MVVAMKRIQVMVENDLKVINVFIEDKELPAKYKDYELKARYKGIRALHLKPDNLLMYVKVEHESVTLLAISSHLKLFK